MSQKYVISFLLFVIVFGESIAQVPNWSWAGSATGAGDDACLGIVLDDTGNIYTTGRFMGTVDFDPGTGVFELTSTGVYDIFVSKLDASGNFLWTKAIGGTNFDIAFGIDIDPVGNIYITGIFNGTCDFDPDTATYNLTSLGGSDIFVSKLDNSGNFVWARSFGQSLPDQGYAIKLDNSGNVYVTGSFNGTVDFDPGAGTFYLNSSLGDAYISKFDGFGNFIHAVKMGGPGEEGGLALDFDDSGNVYTVGAFTSSGDFDPGAGTFNLPHAGGTDSFISKLDSVGNFVWAKGIGEPGDDVLNSIRLDAGNNICIGGYFSGICDFDPGPSVFNLTSLGFEDACVFKLDNLGNFAWAKSVGGSSIARVKSLAVDAFGNVYSAGYFYGTVDFDPGSGVYNITSSGNADAFIIKLDPSGNFAWAKTPDGGGNDVVNSIDLNTAGNVFTVGNFYSTTGIFGSTTLTNADGTGGSADFFVAKLDNVITGTDVIKENGICSIYPNPASGHIFISLDANGFNTEIEIADVFGKIVAMYSVSGDHVEISIENLTEGMYFVRIQTRNFVETKKLLVIKKGKL